MWIDACSHGKLRSVAEEERRRCLRRAEERRRESGNGYHRQRNRETGTRTSASLCPSCGSTATKASHMRRRRRTRRPPTTATSPKSSSKASAKVTSQHCEHKGPAYPATFWWSPGATLQYTQTSGCSIMRKAQWFLRARVREPLSEPTGGLRRKTYIGWNV